MEHETAEQREARLAYARRKTAEYRQRKRAKEERP